MRKTAATLILVSGLAFSTAQAAFFQVYPDGRGPTPTIQSAIDAAAVSGDVILVHAGLYQEEDILVEGKEIMLLGHNGIAILVSFFSGQGAGITLRGAGEDFLLMGFEMRGFAAGVVLENSSADVTHCLFYDCTAGIEISGELSAPEASFCLFDSCATAVSVTAGGAVSLRNLTIVHCATGIAVSGGSVSISRNIIKGADTGVVCSGGSASLSCNDFYLNTVHYQGCGPGDGDIHAMPRFCYAAGPGSQPYLLHIDSPCWAANNDCGVDMGAFIQGYGCEGTGVEETSWGAVKSLYRR